MQTALATYIIDSHGNSSLGVERIKKTALLYWFTSDDDE